VNYRNPRTGSYTVFAPKDPLTGNFRAEPFEAKGEKMIVTEYRGYLIQSIAATGGSTVYRVQGVKDPLHPIFYSLAAAERYVDDLLSVR
jgi:hypothetical protein